MYTNNYHLASSPLSVSLDKLSCYDEAVQIGAIWSDSRISDEFAFAAFHKIVDYLNFEVEALDERVGYVTSREQFEKAEGNIDMYVWCSDIKKIAEQMKAGGKNDIT